MKSLEEVEKEQIIHALSVHHGIISESARALGCSRSSLTYKMKFHQLDWRIFRSRITTPPDVVGEVQKILNSPLPSGFDEKI